MKGREESGAGKERHIVAVQMEYDLGGFTQVIALEERRREALPDLPASDLINIALQKYRYQGLFIRSPHLSMACASKVLLAGLQACLH